MNNEIDKSDLRQKDEISLKELVLVFQQWCKYLWEKKWIIIIVGIIGSGLGLAYSLTKKPVYTATTTFVLESGEKSSGLGAYAGVASMMGIDLGGGGGGIFQGDNIIELYKSKTMVRRALFTPINGNSGRTLIEYYIDMNKMKEGWAEKPELKKLDFQRDDLGSKENARERRLKDSIVGVVVDAVSKSYLNVAKPDKKLNIIQVDVKSTNEQFSKMFNEELVQKVNEFYVYTKTKKSLQNVNILQHKTDSVRAIMNGAIYNAAKISDETPNMNPTRQVQRVAPLQKEQFSAETNKAILAEMVKNLEMGKIALMKETPLIQVIDEPVYPLKKEKFGKAKGLIFGGFIFGFLSVAFLVLKELYRKNL